MSTTRFDEATSVVGEELARKISRRHILARSIKGLATFGAALSVGEIIRGPILADAACCGHYGFCAADYGYTCPGGGGCPSGCSVCTTTHCGCVHPFGYWTACSGQGTCGNGYVVCYDCNCTSCSQKCTCQSSCICCGCCTPAHAQAEADRLHELARLN